MVSHAVFLRKICLQTHVMTAATCPSSTNVSASHSLSLFAPLNPEHGPSIDGDAEYRASEQIKRMIFAEDPHRLMFGSIACGETWYWTEEGAGLGMDVMMKEGYGNAVGGGYPYPAQYRQFPVRHKPPLIAAGVRHLDLMWADCPAWSADDLRAAGSHAGPGLAQRTARLPRPQPLGRCRRLHVPHKRKTPLMYQPTAVVS